MHHKVSNSSPSHATSSFSYALQRFVAFKVVRFLLLLLCEKWSVIIRPVKSYYVIFNISVPLRDTSYVS